VVAIRYSMDSLDFYLQSRSSLPSSAILSSNFDDGLAFAVLIALAGLEHYLCSCWGACNHRSYLGILPVHDSRIVFMGRFHLRLKIDVDT
jgi:hypothetical protein